MNPARARTLPPAIHPGPITMPTPHQPPSPPTARPATPPTPASTARDLADLLRGHGHDHVYNHAFADQAVISLSHLTVWITAHTLTWTHNGHPGTWPARDLDGAARHLTRLIHQPASQQSPRHARRP